jgi:hypothetical protein
MYFCPTIPDVGQKYIFCDGMHDSISFSQAKESVDRFPSYIRKTEGTKHRILI